MARRTPRLELIVTWRSKSRMAGHAIDRMQEPVASRGNCSRPGCSPPVVRGFPTSTNPSRSLTTAWGESRLEDKEVKQADLLSSSLPMQLPKVAKPRTTNDPEAAGSLADDLAAGDPDRPGQLRDRPRDRLRCPGHPDRRLRADAPQYRCQRGRRQLARCRARCNRSTIRRSSRPRSPRPCRPSTPPSRPACSGATTFSRTTTACRAARST